MVANTPSERALYQRAYNAASSVIDGVDLSATDGAAVPDIVIGTRISTE
jgi:hypothetical protein